MTKILVIDDETAIRENIIDTLEIEGYQTYGAEDGAAGVEAALQALPDLVICDIMMPEMDGYSVLQHLRSNDLTANVPFIFVTAKVDRQAMRQGMDLGADDYLTKPFSASELLTAVQTRLQRHALATQDGEKRLEEVKKQLARLVAHELRTPLTSISTVVEMLSRQFEHMSPAQVQELIDIMGKGSKRLNRLVDQLVLLVQLDSGALNANSVGRYGTAAPLWAVLVAAVDQARKIIARPKYVNIVTNEHHVDAQVRCDRQVLRHALAELISNALNFSPENGTVTISQWLADGHVWITIVDEGNGMTPEQIEKALRPFEQVDRDKQEQQGAGLGLVLARGIIEVHSGSFNIESVVGKGTQVTVGLPALSE
jgi:signal transduction histidine kinase